MPAHPCFAYRQKMTKSHLIMRYLMKISRNIERISRIMRTSADNINRYNELLRCLEFNMCLNGLLIFLKLLGTMYTKLPNTLYISWFRFSLRGGDKPVLID